MTYAIRVNGEERVVIDARVGESLLSVLRDRLGLSGAKNACEQGECGSCSVLLDGELVCACLVLAATCADRDVVTIEGISDDAALSDVQRAFVEAGAVQCGFCTPGFVLAVHRLLADERVIEEAALREALSGNLCRCTGYGRILDAVARVASERGLS